MLILIKATLRHSRSASPAGKTLPQGGGFLSATMWSAISAGDNSGEVSIPYNAIRMVLPLDVRFPRNALYREFSVKPRRAQQGYAETRLLYGSESYQPNAYVWYLRRRSL